MEKLVGGKDLGKFMMGSWSWRRSWVKKLHPNIQETWEIVQVEEGFGKNFLSHTSRFYYGEKLTSKIPSKKFGENCSIGGGVCSPRIYLEEPEKNFPLPTLKRAEKFFILSSVSEIYPGEGCKKFFILSSKETRNYYWDWSKKKFRY